MNKQIRLVNQVSKEEAKEVATMNSNINNIKFNNVRNFALANGFDEAIAKMSVEEGFSFMEIVKACETATQELHWVLSRVAKDAYITDDVSFDDNAPVDEYYARCQHLIQNYHSVSAVYRKVLKNRGQVEKLYRPFVSREEWEAKVAPIRRAREAEMEPIHAWNEKYEAIKANAKLETEAEKVMLEMLRQADWLRIKKNQPMMSNDEMKAFIERNAEAVLKRHPEDHSTFCVYLKEATYCIESDQYDLENDDNEDMWVTKRSGKYDLSGTLTDKGQKLGLLQQDPNAPSMDKANDETYLSMKEVFTILKEVRTRHTISEYRNRHDTSSNAYLPHGVKECIIDYHGITIKMENTTLHKNAQQEWFYSRTRAEYLQDVEDDAELRSIEAKLETATRLYITENEPTTTKSQMTLVNRPYDYYKYEVTERNGGQWVNSTKCWTKERKVTVKTIDIFPEVSTRHCIKVQFTDAEMNVLRRLGLAE